MTQDKRSGESKRSKEADVNKRNDVNARQSKDPKSDIPTKVVIRRLPPLLNAETFLQHISPVPDYDYFHFAEADLSLGPHAFTRAYINFVNPKDIWIFQEKFDGYVFVDDRGNEYPAVVEFAPYPRISKKKTKKADPRKGTIEQDPDYLKFLEKLQNTEAEAIPPPELLLEEIEAKEKLLKANHGCPRVTTPLIDFLTRKKEEKKNAFQARDEKRRKDLEKHKLEEERRKKLEKERQERREQMRQKQKEDKKKDEMATTPFKLLRNPEREKEKKEYAVEKASKETTADRPEMESEKTNRNEETRGKEADKKEEKDRRGGGDDRRDSKDKGAKKPEKGFGERKREDERKKENESSSSKDANYGARRRTDGYRDDGEQGQRQSDRDRHKDRAKDGDFTEKDWDRDPGGSRSGSYQGYGKQRDRDGYWDGKREGEKREVKGDYGRRSKDSGKTQAKESQQSKSEMGYGDHGRGGGRRYQDGRSQGSRNKGSSYDNRRDSGSYDNRRDSGNYDNRRDSGNYDNWKDDGKGHGGYYGSRSEKPMGRGREERVSEEKETSPQICDNSEAGKGDFPKTNKSKINNDDDEGNASAAATASKRNEDAESKGSNDRDGSSLSSRQKIRYKDRPEKAIYNPAKRAVERQKESTSNR